MAFNIEDPQPETAPVDHSYDHLDSEAQANDSNVVDFESATWRKGIITNAKGAPKPCLSNALLVLAQHPDWKGVLAYDQLAEKVLKLKAPPTRKCDGASEPGYWNDADSARTAAWLHAKAKFGVSSGVVAEAVAVVAEKRIVHPIRDYLDRLRWDNVPRLDQMLSTYFRTRDTPYERAVSACWMISAVARVMQPGCQADYMLILEGKQGRRKSTGLQILGGQWFTDAGITIGDKDSYQQMRGIWIYEFGELDALRGRDQTKVKGFLTQRIDRYRPSYARSVRDFPRQTVFAGSTNEDNYLPDRTGNRRYWPARCLRVVDTDALTRDRDQLWAEAFARYQAGEQWFIGNKDLVRLFEAEQLERQAPDDWEHIVADWLACPTMEGGPPADLRDGVTTAQILLGAIRMRPSDISNAHSTRAGHVLRALGWDPTPNPVYREGKRVRLYRRGCASSVGCADPGVSGQLHDSTTQTANDTPDTPAIVHTRENRGSGDTRSGMAIEAVSGCAVSETAETARPPSPPEQLPAFAGPPDETSPAGDDPSGWDLEIAP
jgi:putative DNA primase/helicase